jgi:hypothetical protein
MNDSAKIRLVGGALAALAVCLVLFLIAYTFAGKVDVMVDGSRQTLPDSVAVSRAILEPELMSNFGFRMAVLRLGHQERNAVCMDFEHIPLHALPPESAVRLKLVRGE